MKKIVLALVIGSVVSAFASLLFASPTWAAPATSGWWDGPTRVSFAYPLFCRGPFELATRPSHARITPGGGGSGLEPFTPASRGAGPDDTEVAIPFRRNDRAAGAGGSALSPGACAWVDRPVNAGEPDVLKFTVTQTFHAVQTAIYDTILICSTTPGCVFAINAGGVTRDDGAYLAGVGMLRLHHPQSAR